MIVKLTQSESAILAAEKKIEEPIDASAWATKYLYQLMMGWIFRDFGKAVEAIEAFSQYEKGLTGSYSIVLFYFYKTLTLLTLFCSAPFIKRFNLKRTIKQGIARLKKYAKQCPASHQHKYLLLQAEWARINGKFVKAEELYEEAIECAAKEKILHEAAIASELACRFYLEKKRTWLALLFLQQAFSYYEKWGAQNKVEQLQAEFVELLQVQDEVEAEKGTNLTVSIKTASIKTRVEDRTLKIGAAALDISVIQKSMEAITSTILMDDLLKNLMGLAIEHAGAERGLLLMAKKKEFFIEAEGDKRSDETRLLHSSPIKPDSLPVTVLQTVIRSREPLLLREAFRERYYKDDPYIKAGRNRSIFCLPLLNKEEITAILYLENNLAKNAFTGERCSLLYFLSSQLAMSIDNAKLHEGTIELNSELKKLNLSYERFVPKDFLSLLGKKQITEVAPGDHTQQNMSILFLDIREFTKLSETMTPTENFAFINEFVGLMEPIIRMHKGFIDKYIGDAIMALFPETVDDALSCAIEMIKALQQYNHLRVEQQQVPIRIGIGINSGPLILGTIGNENRMDGTVISDAVNIASRVEHLTKEYGQSILITENACRQLKNPARYSLQVLAQTEIRGKKEKITLYGISNGRNIIA